MTHGYVLDEAVKHYSGLTKEWHTVSLTRDLNNGSTATKYAEEVCWLYRWKHFRAFPLMQSEYGAVLQFVIMRPEWNSKALFVIVIMYPCPSGAPDGRICEGLSNLSFLVSHD